MAGECVLGQGRATLEVDAMTPAEKAEGANGTPHQFDPTGNYEIVPDFMVLLYFRRQLGIGDS